MRKMTTLNIYTMAHILNSPKTPLCAARLCQDMGTLINNHQGSDVQFKIGGASLHEGGENIYNEPETVTFYAHSIILRCRSQYFATMLDEDKCWKESSSGVIYKPNISPSTFHDILHFIYTGNIHANNLKNIIDLIIAAEEMDFEELSIQCQAQLIRTVKHIFHDNDNESGDKNESREISEESTNQHVPIDVAIRTHIIPVLNLASSHSLSYLSQELLTVMLSNMSMIMASSDTCATFVSGISSEILFKIVTSNDLTITERRVWDLVLSWGCYQTRLSKIAVEECLSKPEDDEMDGCESTSETVINDFQLSQLKATLSPFLPSIRFSLLTPDDYYQMFDILSNFLSRHRLSELNKFFLNPDRKGQLDSSREISWRKPFSEILGESTTWHFLRENIFEKGGIIGCLSLNHLKFELLFRASEHGFRAMTFHQHCDNKGPTLVLARSTDGDLFGGVNFNHWKSDNSKSLSSLNFLFALSDGCYRKSSEIFGAPKYEEFSRNEKSYGPSFGSGCDLHISESGRYIFFEKGSHGPRRYFISDYEVFAISKI